MAKTDVLIDSSIWIHGFAPRAPSELKNVLSTLLETDRASVTDMVRLEVIGGAGSVQEFEAFRADFGAVRCLEITAREWKKAEDMSFVLNRKGKRVPVTDVLIAAAAVCYGIPLWHADGDFERIKTCFSSLDTFWHPKHKPPI